MNQVRQRLLSDYRVTIERLIMARRPPSLRASLSMSAPCAPHSPREYVCVFQQKHAKNFHIFFFCLQTSTFDRSAAVPREMERPVCFCFCRTSMIIFFIQQSSATLRSHTPLVRSPAHHCPAFTALSAHRCLHCGNGAHTEAPLCRSFCNMCFLHTHTIENVSSPHCIRHPTHTVCLCGEKEKRTFLALLVRSAGTLLAFRLAASRLYMARAVLVACRAIGGRWLAHTACHTLQSLQTPLFSLPLQCVCFYFASQFSELSSGSACVCVLNLISFFKFSLIFTIYLCKFFDSPLI